MATVKIPPVLRQHTGGEAEVGAEGATVGEVLRALARAHPDTQAQLFGAEGDLNRYVNVYLNDEDVRVLDGLDTSVSGERHGGDPAGDGRRPVARPPNRRVCIWRRRSYRRRTLGGVATGSLGLRRGGRRFGRLPDRGSADHGEPEEHRGQQRERDPACDDIGGKEEPRQDQKRHKGKHVAD